MARAKTVSGTFSGTGQSDTCFGEKILIKMDFAGTASVDVEVALGTAWVKAGDPVTADEVQVFESPVAVELRLNCTAHTNNVVYEMQAALDE